MDTDLFRTFSLVAKLKNMTKAAEIVGVTHSSISRQIKTLENILKVKLVQTSTNGVQLTEAGEAFAVGSNRVWQEMEKTIANLKEINDAEEGPIQVLTTHFGFQWFAHYAEEFRDRYPNIQIQMSYDNYADLFYDNLLSGVYVGLLGFPPPSGTTNIWLKFGQQYWFPYAHPDYLKKYGTPKTYSDLDGHHFIAFKWVREYPYTDRQSNFLLYAGRENGNPRKANLYVDDVVGCRAMIDRKVGIGMIQRFQAAGTPLVQLFEDLYDPKEGPIFDTYFIYPPHLKTNKRVQILKEFVFEKASKGGLFD